MFDTNLGGKNSSVQFSYKKKFITQALNNRGQYQSYTYIAGDHNVSEFLQNRQQFQFSRVPEYLYFKNLI